MVGKSGHTQLWLIFVFAFVAKPCNLSPIRSSWGCLKIGCPKNWWLINVNQHFRHKTSDLWVLQPLTGLGFCSTSLVNWGVSPELCDSVGKRRECGHALVQFGGWSVGISWWPLATFGICFEGFKLGIFMLFQWVNFDGMLMDVFTFFNVILLWLVEFELCQVLLLVWRMVQVVCWKHQSGVQMALFVYTAIDLVDTRVA